MTSDEKRRASFELVLTYRMEQLLIEIDDLESKISTSPPGDIDPLIKARVLAALEAARRPIEIFLMGEGEELTPIM